MMLPGDDGFPGQSIAEIFSHAGEADIIIPIVTNPGARSWFRAFASKGFTTLLNWTFWLNVGYYNGAVLQRNDLLRAIEIRTNSFAYQAEALVKLIARGATLPIYVRIQDRRRAALRAAAEEPNGGVENHPAFACGGRAVPPTSAGANAVAA